jgi:hypothetical protein
MPGLIKKNLAVIISVGFMFWGGSVQTGYAQQKEPPKRQANPADPAADFIQKVNRTVSLRAAQLAFDLNKRPVIGILVADFSNGSGEEIVIGDQIGSKMRAFLNRNSQFNVYGREDPLSQSLRASLTADPQWSAASQRKFQQFISKKFKSSPVDLVVTGQVLPEMGDRLKVLVNIIPFYEPINLVESESGRTDIHKEQFVSPTFPLPEIVKDFSVIQQPQKQTGRLVIVSLLPIAQAKTLLSVQPGEGAPNLALNAPSQADTWKLKSLNDLGCWLDDNGLTVLTDWEDSKKKDYYDILSGLKANTIWFDDLVAEGTHSLFLGVSMNSQKDGYRSFLRSFSVKSGTSNYLFFSLYSDMRGEPGIRLHYVTDPENRPLPF